MNCTVTQPPDPSPLLSNRQLTRFIQQSNLIEGIARKPTDAEFDAHKRFLSLYQITIPDLEAFVQVVAPGKPLRTQPGMNVRVGSHVAPPGCPDIAAQLQAILDRANVGWTAPWETHCQYQMLHPFLDGNGRSGRVLWLWQQRGKPLPPLLFLQSFYYQTLSNFRS